jgi:hypothetical protein
VNPPYTFSIETGVRNLLLGRVLLKKDMNAGDTVIPVGDEFEDLPGCTVPGSNLFYNYQTQGVLVQPAATNRPGAVDHQEAVTLVQGLPNATHLGAAAPVANGYTVAGAAYIRLQTLPDASQGLKLIALDILDPLAAPADHLFPGALVIGVQAHTEDWSNVEDMDHCQIIVRYARLMDGENSRELLRSDLEQLSFLLRQDRYLGGTAVNSQINRPYVMNPTPGRTPTAYVQTAAGTRLDWGDIYLTADRLVVIDKSIK